MEWVKAIAFLLTAGTFPVNVGFVVIVLHETGVI